MPTEFPPVRRKRKSLNVVALKQVAVFTAAVLTGLGSAVTGLGAQLAFAPMLSWMLGYNDKKSAGMAFSFALSVSFATVVGVLSAQPALWSALILAFPLFIGMTGGALIGAKFVSPSRRAAINRAFLGVAIMFLAFILLQVSRENISTPHLGAKGVPFLLYLGLGLAAGAISHATKIPSGVPLIPGLYYFIGLKAIPAIATAHAIVWLASSIPAWAAARTQNSEPTYARPITLAGCLSGFAGGRLLIHYQSNEARWALLAFAVVGMFLCARELSMQSAAPTPPRIDSESDVKSGD